MKNSDRGITLVEIAVVIFIIVLFSMIIIADFPKILRSLALSRATYQLAQDLRKTEDLGLSGVPLNDASMPPSPILVKGYGVYVNFNASPATQYVIYADVNNDQKFENAGTPNCYNNQYFCCNQVVQGNPIPVNRQLTTDCVMEMVDVSQENPSLSISGITDGNSANGVADVIVARGISINFIPPNPTINIYNSDATYSGSKIGIILKNTDGSNRTIWMSASGLIDVQ